MIAAPLIFRLYTLSPAAGVDADVLHDVGTTLTRIFLIQILFYGLTGVANAFLNSRRRFFAAAWSPILPNLIIAATLLSLPSPEAGGWQLGDVLTDDRLRWTLGLGATAGIATMALALIPAVLRTGFHVRPVWNWRHPAVRRLLTMSAWTLGFVAANQVALIVVRNLADPGSGDAAAYFDAFIFFVLPHGLLAVSIATTFQPEMSRAVARHDRESFISHTSLGVRLIALFTIPAGVGMFVLRRPIVGALLQHGEYGADDALATSRALGGFALGLVGFSVYLFVLRGFYAHHDTRTPFVVNVFQNAINVVLAIILVDRYGVLGLGLAPRPRLHRGGGLGLADHGLQGARVPCARRPAEPVADAARGGRDGRGRLARRRCHRQQQRHRCGLARRRRRADRDGRLRRAVDRRSAPRSWPPFEIGCPD